MNLRTLMPGKANEANLTSFLGIEEGLQRTILREAGIWIRHADYFVNLHEIEMIDLQSLQGFIDLFGGSFAIASINFGHHKCLSTIAGFQCLTHALFTYTAVIIPAVVQKVDTAIKGRLDDTNGR